MTTPEAPQAQTAGEKCFKCDDTGLRWDTSDWENVGRTYCTCPRGKELEDLDLAAFLNNQPLPEGLAAREK
jgi:hypothetical protein